MGSVTLDNPGLAPSPVSADGYIPAQDISAKLIIVMVGLPARGKSYIVKQLARYMNWLQYETRIFNVGDRRRTATAENNNSDMPSSSAGFFDNTDLALVTLRDKIALGTLDELLDWLFQDDGTIGIFDATNVSQRRRQLILSHIRERPGPDPNILFLESCCSDQDILQKNFVLKLSGPDYRHEPPDKALADFRQRVSNYEKSYIPLGVAEENQSIPYVQMIDAGRKINTHMIRGYIPTQIVEYLLNFNLSERQIWISCNGQSLNGTTEGVGRSSHLTNKGRKFANGLANFIQEQRDKWSANRIASPESFSCPQKALQPSRGFCIWTSMMTQAIETAQPFPDDLYAKRQIRMLDDLNTGDMTDLSIDDIQALYSSGFTSGSQSMRLQHWPEICGEVYADVINRLRPVIIELERTTNHLLLITHRSVIQVLLAYFLGPQANSLADSTLEEESVFCLEPHMEYLYTAIATIMKQILSENFVDKAGRVTYKFRGI